MITKEQLLTRLEEIEAQLDDLRTELNEDSFHYAVLTADDLSSDLRKFAFQIDELVEPEEGK